MKSFLWGIVGGIVAWAAIAILGQPLYRFFGLRAQAAELLARYERHDPRKAGADAMDAIWLAERKRAYQECGSHLIAFTDSNVIVTRLLSKLRFYPRLAANALLALSELSPGSTESLTMHDEIISGLKLDLGRR